MQVLLVAGLKIESTQRCSLEKHGLKYELLCLQKHVKAMFNDIFVHIAVKQALLSKVFPRVGEDR